MIGRNDTGPIFSIADGAEARDLGRTRTTSACSRSGRSAGTTAAARAAASRPTCSSISQSTYQFTSIFGGFTG